MCVRSVDLWHIPSSGFSSRSQRSRGRSASYESRAAGLRSGLCRRLGGRHAEFNRVRQYADSKFARQHRAKGQEACCLAPRAAISGDGQDGEGGDDEGGGDDDGDDHDVPMTHGDKIKGTETKPAVGLTSQWLLGVKRRERRWKRGRGRRRAAGDCASVCCAKRVLFFFSDAPFLLLLFFMSVGLEPLRPVATLRSNAKAPLSSCQACARVRTVIFQSALAPAALRASAPPSPPAHPNSHNPFALQPARS